MSIKKTKVRTGIFVECACGAKAMVYEIGGCRWFSHCVSCGSVMFISSAQVFERVKAGGVLCPHKPVLKACKDGMSMTSWCGVCRTRVFVPAGGKGSA